MFDDSSSAQDQATFHILATGLATKSIYLPSTNELSLESNSTKFHFHNTLHPSFSHSRVQPNTPPPASTLAVLVLLVCVAQFLLVEVQARTVVGLFAAYSGSEAC